VLKHFALSAYSEFESDASIGAQILIPVNAKLLKISSRRDHFGS